LFLLLLLLPEPVRQVHVAMHVVVALTPYRCPFCNLRCTFERKSRTAAQRSTLLVNNATFKQTTTRR
jgi:hypothetical protein